MNETLNEETDEELETKYNLIFENKPNTVSQILSSEDASDVEGNTKENPEEDDPLAKERAEECTALVTVKEHRLMAAQTMFKKSIKISIKSFLISLSLSFLNLFI